MASDELRLSFIVPAFNEQKLIGACLRSISSSLSEHKRVHAEVIVVDNNSTDDTAALATDNGARVVFEPVNQISRARNTGAATASGDWLAFIDADSELSAELLTAVVDLIDSGEYIGCGSLMQIDDLPLWGRLMLKFWGRLSVTKNWAAGSFFVCRADAFRELGGFSDKLFAAEEVELSRRLKKLARNQGLRFTVLTANPVKTSNRKIDLYSGWEMFRQFGRLILRPRKSLKDKKKLNIWYDGRR